SLARSSRLGLKAKLLTVPPLTAPAWMVRVPLPVAASHHVTPPLAQTASSWPSEVKATVCTRSGRVNGSLLVATSHTFAVYTDGQLLGRPTASETLARRLPSGLKARLRISAVFGVNPRMRSRKVTTGTFVLAVSHNFTVRSIEPLARRLPSGL